MSSPIDPIRRLKRWLRLTWTVTAMVMAGCAWWAFAPLQPQAELPQLKEPAPVTTPDSNRDQPIQPEVFAAKLWNPPAQPEPKPEALAEAPPPTPLNIQLIGIIEEGAGVRRAAVYDADRDVLLILSSGDQILGQTVKSITEQGIELTDGRATRRLVLKRDAS